VRNPMAGIEMSLSNLRDETDDADHAARLDRVVSELHRISRQLQNLLDRTRHTPEPVKPLRLAETIEDVLALTRYQLPDRIRLVSGIPAGLVFPLPEERLRQTVLNLVLNATQAVGDDEGTVTVGAQVDGGALELRVCDNGPGFPRHILEGAIQPFVTGRDRGTGLGLAMVQRFVREYKGRMAIANTEPHGACVTLTIPGGAKSG
jgi:two-component system NtrC family sensor kinase